MTAGLEAAVEPKNAASSSRGATGGAGVREVDPRTLSEWIKAGRATVIDVREPDEHAAERIAGSVPNPLSKFDPALVPKSGDGCEVVLHCRGGRRSAEAAARLIASGRASATHLTGGLEAWKAEGRPVERAAGRVPISIMRQVQITAGSIVFVGTILAWFVSPWFLLLTGFVGAGLTVAGSTGTCGMALVLARMPWNRALCAANKQNSLRNDRP